MNKITHIIASVMISIGLVAGVGATSASAATTGCPNIDKYANGSYFGALPLNAVPCNITTTAIGSVVVGDMTKAANYVRVGNQAAAKALIAKDLVAVGMPTTRVTAKQSNGTYFENSRVANLASLADAVRQRSITVNTVTNVYMVMFYQVAYVHDKTNYINNYYTYMNWVASNKMPEVGKSGDWTKAYVVALEKSQSVVDFVLLSSTFNIYYGYMSRAVAS